MFITASAAGQGRDIENGHQAKGIKQARSGTRRYIRLVLVISGIGGCSYAAAMVRRNSSSALATSRFMAWNRYSREQASAAFGQGSTRESISPHTS
jgi:hypothetical protein